VLHDKRVSFPSLIGPRFFLGLWGLVVLAAAHAFAWGLFLAPPSAPNIVQPMSGLAYNGYGRWNSPADPGALTTASLSADLALLAPHSHRLRTYSATELPTLPALAQEQGLSVTLGAWLDQNPIRNQAELRAAIAAARDHKNVERLILGNETQLTERLPAEHLYQILDQTRRQLLTPVSTAEPWHVWLAQPELAKHVDFITVHLLPYWEKVPAEQAVSYALARLQEVQRRFPQLPIVIGEVGWPSHGPPQGPAIASPENQALFVRQFVTQAQALGLEYYLMEAIDQPWKKSIEGQAGAHWGLWDTDRQPKFPLQGPLEQQAHTLGQAILSALVGLAVAVPFLFGLARLRTIARLGFLFPSQLLVIGTVAFSSWPFADYLEPIEFMLAAGLVCALTILTLLMLSQLFEFSEVFWRGNLRRQKPTPPWAEPATAPKVSIHLACSNEPPAMVIQAIRQLLRLDWPALEIIVVDNNTTDPDLWRPVAAFADQCGDHRLRFFRLPQWPGFKAGALNFALRQTDPEAGWVGVVDADYLVDPRWIQAVSGYFQDPTTGLIQAPQAHRDALVQPFSRLAYWEYEGFFRIGMHHRHQRNAIIQHGTMTLIRAQTLQSLGGWNEDCICEDSELGLRILAQRLKAVYVDEVLGQGLLPDDFSSYRRQRRRWAQGAMQILKAHARKLLAPSTLTRSQRYHFLAGWLPWMGDVLHLLFSLGAIVWTLGALASPRYFPLPDPLLLLPLIAFLGFRLVIGLALYARRVDCPWPDLLGASIAGLALSHVIARGLLAGLVHKKAVFEITRKKSEGLSPAAGLTPAHQTPAYSPLARQLFAVREELVLGLSLFVLFCIFWLMPSETTTPDRLSWSGVLVLQALPYLAAIGCAVVSGLGQPQAQRLETRRAGVGHRAHWASPESRKSVLTVDIAPQNPQHPH
jgi:exo-beta-1,3-glucanase (GH17 family)/cellulose synthase/poly-beta-1,6-N-acetylglucosamine synthase-like glycosyltransferase